MVKHLPNLDAARPEYKVAMVNTAGIGDPVKDAPVPLTRRIFISHNPRSSWDWRCASPFPVVVSDESVTPSSRTGRLNG
ncbi:hypothetical protein EV130_12020 [Rhizobium azibense]|uniref:Uncharacterized protein n=1 Tax=Rhizobium azibense TaxID=1136135 RepID=A0A4R3QC32_9HYPH|nr:hypothetical protein EV130_12020 [Rhizobium azibense]